MRDEFTRLDKFKEVARQLGTNDDPERLKERLAKHEPGPEESARE